VLLTRLIETAGPKAIVLRLEVEPGVPLSSIVQEAISGALPTLVSAPKRVASKLDAALRALPRIHEQPRLLPLRTAIATLNEAAAVIDKFLVDEIHDVDIPSLRTIAAAV